MVDVTKYTFSKGTQTNADDLISAPRTVVVTGVEETRDAQQPLAVRYSGDDGKPFLPCLTMRKLIAALWGGESDNWIGKSMTLYRDPSVIFGKDTLGGVRISHMSGLDKTVSVQLLEKRGKRRMYTIVPIETKPQETPDKLDHAALQSEFEASKTMTPEDKKAWWGTKSQDERAVLAEMAKGNV